MRLALIAALIALLPLAASAQDAAKPESARPDPALAQTLAAAYQLTNADGDRVCAITLKPDVAGAHFAVAFDKAACAATIAFTANVSAWSPGPGGEIRLLGAKGALVVEFTEGVAGTWEGLREEDGVYFLNNPSLADPSKQTQPADMFGDWDAARQDGKPICRLVFGETQVADGAYQLTLGSGCDAAVLRFGPVSWRIERGDLMLLSAKGDKLRFAAQEDGAWAKVPEGSRPLMLSRPPQ